mmetsp:Transcript_15033/g.30408  ORF Transcript_15033/g.30408 Transcript_15033/m.30408 type:complete len:87 (+) Transcript_15033:1567-1827(+)
MQAHLLPGLARRAPSVDPIQRCQQRFFDIDARLRQKKKKRCRKKDANKERRTKKNSYPPSAFKKISFQLAASIGAVFFSFSIATPT